jgi:hypothetical protein
MAMSDESPTPPKDKVKPWLSRTVPLVSFHCDDGVLYLAQFHRLSAVSPEPQRVEIFAPPHGVMVITGPEARHLCYALEAQHATEIRADGVVLSSVTRVADKEDAARQLEAELPAVDPEPGIGELD